MTAFFARAAASVLAIGLAATLLASPTSAADGLPRLPGTKLSADALSALPKSDTVTVKFAEGTGLRLRGAGFTAENAGTAAAVTRALRALGADLAAARRLHTRPEAELDAERTTLMAESGEDLADLNLYYVLPVPKGMTAAAFAAKLNELPEVEFAEPSPVPAPPPVDISPTTPNFTSSQGYRKAPPAGVGALNPATVRGGDGRNVKVADLEYSWQFNHEDLELSSSINLDTTATPSDPFSDTNHGTAVLGEIVGRKNAYGVTGLAPAATARVVPANTVQFGYNPARAISIATAKLARGDVLVIEQQYWVCGLSGDRYGPLEWLQSVFDAVKAATAKGIIVVAAAGNGNVNLDAANCQGLFNRNVRNSRALIVGAGDSSTHRRLSFSSFGSRVDVQGWGHNVTTTGYGDAFNAGVRQLYTRQFSGTSSATPIVSGAVAAIQGVLKARGLRVASPTELRTALRATGTPQPSNDVGKIGPLPAIQRAVNYIIAHR